MKQQERRTWAEISLPNLEHNYRALRALLPEGCRISGRGEGRRLRPRGGPRGPEAGGAGGGVPGGGLPGGGQGAAGGRVLTPILLLGYTPTDCAEELLHYGLTQTVYDLESARAFSAAAQAAGRRLRIHVKADTGMSRLAGCVMRDTGRRRPTPLPRCAPCPALEVEGIYTTSPMPTGTRRYTMGPVHPLSGAAVRAGGAGNHVPNPPLRRQRCRVKVSLYSSGYGAPRGGPVRPLSRPSCEGLDGVACGR